MSDYYFRWVESCVASHLSQYDYQRKHGIELTTYSHFGCSITSPRVSRLKGLGVRLPDPHMTTPTHIQDLSSPAFVAFPKPWKQFADWVSTADPELYRVPGSLTNRWPATRARYWRKFLVRWAIEHGKHMTYPVLPGRYALAVAPFEKPDGDSSVELPKDDVIFTRSHAAEDTVGPVQELMVR